MCIRNVACLGVCVVLLLGCSAKPTIYENSGCTILQLSTNASPLSITSQAIESTNWLMEFPGKHFYGTSIVVTDELVTMGVSSIYVEPGEPTAVGCETAAHELLVCSFSSENLESSGFSVLLAMSNSSEASEVLELMGTYWNEVSGCVETANT